MNTTKSHNNYLPSPLVNQPLLISILIYLSIIIVTWQVTPSPHVDNEYYLKVAQGFSVIAPFSKRILYPDIAMALHKFTGISLDHSFMLANTIALLILIISVTYLVDKLTTFPLLSALFLFNPFLIRVFKEAILPDLFFAALLGIFFIFLYHSLFWPSLVLLFLLYFTRDNALFVCLALAVAAWWQGRLKWAVGGLVAIPAANVILSWITSGKGGTNMYEISNFLYMVFKVPKNLLYNVFGILIWNNIHPTVGIPVIKFDLPSWLPLGALHTLGICQWEPAIPLRTITLILTTFGLLPLLLGFILIRNYQVVKGASLWLLVALLYGCSSFLVGVMVSLDIGRQIGYAWPVFWLAAPVLLLQNYQLSNSVIYRLTSYQIALYWLPWFLTPWLVTRFQDQVPFSIIYVLLLALVLQVLALRELLTLRRREELSQ